MLTPPLFTSSFLTVVFSLYVAAQQENGVQYPAAIPASAVNDESVVVNFTSLFVASNVGLMPGTEAWAPREWNGLTTFAHTTPLRCFGADADVPYDVAVLGEFLGFLVRRVSS